VIGKEKSIYQFRVRREERKVPYQPLTTSLSSYRSSTPHSFQNKTILFFLSETKELSFYTRKTTLYKIFLKKKKKVKGPEQE
jgi:hypothetical protein